MIMEDEAKMVDNGGAIEAQETIASDSDASMEAFLDTAMATETETPTDSSSEDKLETPTPTEEPATAEVDKTEQVNDVESDGSLSPEEKIAKVQEILGDDVDAIDAYVKEKGYHNDPAWKAQRALIQTLKDKEQESSMTEEERSILSSPEYIMAKLAKEGVTDKAIIDYKLKEAGFEPLQQASETPNDIQLAAKALGVDPMAIPSENRAVIEDIAKVARAIFTEEFGTKLPETLAPYQDMLDNTQRQQNAGNLVKSMQATVKDEGILDYEKDIVPELNAYLDSNANVSQEDVLSYFKDLNHKLVIKRKGVIDRGTQRREAKGSNRPLDVGVTPGKLPAKTGNDDEDADAFFLAMGMND